MVRPNLHLLTCQEALMIYTQIAMVNPKPVRSRSRHPRQVRASKGWTPTRTLDIPSELQAPITGEIERQLKQFVALFGEKKVLEALDALVTKCKWNDWQCVANAIRRIRRKA
jgi:hypothetical protein